MILQLQTIADSVSTATVNVELKLRHNEDNWMEKDAQLGGPCVCHSIA